LLVAEKLELDDDVQPLARKSRSRNKSRKAKKAKLIHENHSSLSDDPDLDANYTDAKVSDGSSDDEDDAIVITNEEVRNDVQLKCIGY
jgi:hypothetical protein